MVSVEPLWTYEPLAQTCPGNCGCSTGLMLRGNGRTELAVRIGYSLCVPKQIRPGRPQLSSTSMVSTPFLDSTDSTDSTPQWDALISTLFQVLDAWRGLHSSRRQSSMSSADVQRWSNFSSLRWKEAGWSFQNKKTGIWNGQKDQKGECRGYLTAEYWRFFLVKYVSFFNNG